jgi:hypothetical protein
MAWNKSGIKDITINFDLSKLLKHLQSDKKFMMPKKIEVENYKKVAESIKNNIQNGNFSNNAIKADWDTMTYSKSADLQPSTQYIRKWRGNKPQPPLIETGNLVNSIRATKNGITMADYGMHHVKGYKIKGNAFTKKWNIPAGTRVPVRNFIHSLNIDITSKNKQDIVKKINDTLKTKEKPLRR